MESPRMRDDFPSGSVTFLFTDVEGSTKRMHELGEAVLPSGSVAARHPVGVVETGAAHAHRVFSHRDLVDPTGGDRGDAEAPVRARHRALRRDAAGPTRGRRARASSRSRPFPRG